MKAPAWRIDDEDYAPELAGLHQPLLVTGRMMRDALARTWTIWVAAAVLGALAGLGTLLFLPHSGTATTTLLMVHPDGADEAGMTTDVNLLTTRSVATDVIADLGLTESPDAFLASVTATPVTNQILELEVSGVDDDDAVARAESLVDNFLAFRAQQLRSVSDGLVEGYEGRIADLQAQVDALSAEYDALPDEGRVDNDRASEILTERATLNTQITGMQRDVEDATLQTDAAITATHVIDAPVASAHGSRRQMVLYGASGAIAAAAVAMGTILFLTLTSDVLRRRREVAAALGVPVRVGVGKVRAQGALARSVETARLRVAELLRGHPARWISHRMTRNRQALVAGLESALPSRFATASHDGPRATGRRGGPTTLGVAAIDRTDTAALIVHGLGERLRDRGHSVLLVDLSTSGALEHLVRRVEEQGTAAPACVRPSGVPGLAVGPRRGGRRAATEAPVPAELSGPWDDSDVVLVLLEVDPGIDLDILRSWVNRVVPLVSAGRASAELLGTVAELVTGAGVDMPFALLEGAERSDRTLGRPGPSAEDRTEPKAARSQ
jgi:hypothetical protein